MGLEDIVLFPIIPGPTVSYPSDAASTKAAVELVANTKGTCQYGWHLRKRLAISYRKSQGGQAISEIAPDYSGKLLGKKASTTYSVKQIG